MKKTPFRGEKVHFLCSVVIKQVSFRYKCVDAVST